MDEPMKKSGLPRYVVEDRNRDGSPRLRFRRAGAASIDMPGPKGSKTFWEAYAAALAGKSRNTRASAAPRRVVALEGSMRHAFERWIKAGDNANADPLTISDKRGTFETILAEPLEVGGALTFENCPLKSLTRRHIVVLRDRKATFPTAANKRLAYLSQLFDWAVESEYMPANLTKEVSRLTVRPGGFHSWAPEEVRQYQARHPIGTKARLALSLIAFAGLRRSDVCQIGKQHLQGGWLVKPQHKNRKRKPKTIEVPVLPELQAAIDACPSKGLSFLETDYGRPYSIKGFGMRFKRWCKEADLPHCSAHGVRKAAAAVAAENGATEAQLMAIFNWEEAGEVITYIRKMNRRKMAGEAMHLLTPREANQPTETGSKNVG